MFTSPHHTEFSVVSSHTINLSFGDLPVNSPVSAASAPESTKVPSPRVIASSTSSAGVKFQYAAATLANQRSATVALADFKPNSLVINFCLVIFVIGAQFTKI